MYGLKEKDIERINAVFANNESVTQVVLYGSRSKGTFQDSSDIDLTIKGDLLDSKAFNRIANELDDLLLPYKIDLSLYHKISNPDLIAHINRVGQVFYCR